MKEVLISKKAWEKTKLDILAEIPNYAEYAAESRAAREVLRNPNAKLFGGNKEEGWTFTLHEKATPENVLLHLKARRFPIEFDNVRYTEKGGVVYAHASGGNRSRSLWGKGKKIDTVITGKVLVKLD